MTFESIEKYRLIFPKKETYFYWFISIYHVKSLWSFKFIQLSGVHMIFAISLLSLVVWQSWMKWNTKFQAWILTRIMFLQMNFSEHFLRYIFNSNYVFRAQHQALGRTCTLHHRKEVFQVFFFSLRLYL